MGLNEGGKMHETAPEMPNEVQVSLRLPSDLIERAEALVDRLRKEPDNVILGVTRADVLRLALARGIVALEEETKAKSAKRSRE